MLFYVDLGASGRIGFEYVDAKGIIRKDMVPGDGCLRPGRERPHTPMR